MYTFTIIPTTGIPFDIKVDSFAIETTCIKFYTIKNGVIGTIPLNYGFIMTSCIQYPA